MPLIINEELPAYDVLRKEHVFVVNPYRAVHQDIRPLRIAILNLMPNKIETEVQLMRLLSNTPLQVEIELLQMKSHNAKNTASEYLNAFYKTFDDVKDQKFDGLIITGAPIENYEFEEVDFWPELCEILEWEKSHVFSVLHICWGAQAALYYHYGINKVQLDKKLFGIFEHKVMNRKIPLVRGFDDVFYAPHSRHTAFYCPHSRHTEVRGEDIRKVDDLEILAESAGAGPHIIADKSGRRIFLTGHFEYDADSLAKEFYRDLDKGLPIQLPYGYFPEDDPKQAPLMRWKAHANLFYSNWLNYFVYQETPYHINDIQA